MNKREEKNDRRWIRTRNSIKNAFSKLLLDKGFEQITVKAVVDLADINRNTFYLHYDSIYDLMEEMEEGIIDSLIEVLDKTDLTRVKDEPYLFYKNLTRLLYSDIDLYTAILRSEKSSTIIPRAKQVLMNRVSKLLSKRYDFSPFVMDTCVDFITSGMVAVYQSWILSDKSNALDDISKLVSLMMSGCASALFNEKLVKEM